MKYILIFTLMLIFGCASTVQEPIEQANQIEENRLCIETTCIQIEKAITQQEQTQGLMFRTELSQNNGMLFIFQDEQIRNFWMKNTLIPLDMIWINENKEIIGITENVPPCKQDPCEIYSSPSKAKYVLEVNAGFSKNHDLKTGQKTQFN